MPGRNAVDAHRGASSARPHGRALITGASSGIGLAFTMALARSCRDLVLVARDRQRLERAADRARALGATTEIVAADLVEPTGLEHVLERIGDSSRPIDLLVNNAGFGCFGAFAELPELAEEAAVALNVRAVVRLTRAALPSILERGHGGIINVASLAALSPGPFNATYSAAKAFVVSFTRAIAEESRSSAITIMVLCPGFTRTEFHERAGVEWRLSSLGWMDSDVVVRKALCDYERGALVSVPGIGNKLAAIALRTMPARVSTRMSATFIRRLADTTSAK